MPFTPGTRLGPYEILAPIGAGGMGEVYSARDTRLDRTVAIKVSTSQFSERFDREARAVAALNHPNICTLHDIGPNYLVMEFIDGQSLDRLIPPSGMQLADALRTSIRVADGLAAAHKIGIIHRDLKPGNVMVSAEGVVKLLDFGLAAIDDASLPTGQSIATRTVAAGAKTVEGTIVGTYSYMSPEQAEGRKLDPRSDIFSFGSLLYEMLTGKRAFRGETAISTLAAILNQEPKPPAELGTLVPPDLQRIVARCLRKDPDRRFQHASDLRVELQEVADAQSSGTLAPVPVEPRRTSRFRGWAPYAAVTALLVGIAAGWMVHRPPPPFQGPKVTRATYDSGLTCDAAISPDGKLLAYASDRAGQDNLDIWVQPVSGGDAVQLTSDAADESAPSFSPDGSQLVYRSERDGGGIYVIGALGGQARLVAREGRTPRFSPDGSQIAYWTGKGGRTEDYARQGGHIFLVPAGGGEPRPIAPNISHAASPMWSPDGRKLLFVGQRPRTRRHGWYITSVADDRPVMTNAAEVLEGFGNQTPTPSQWLPSNQIIFAELRTDGANLYRIGIDAAAAKVTGQPQQLTFGGGVEDAPSVAANGLTAMTDLTWNFDIWSLPIDARTARVTGEPVRLTDSLVAETRPSLSADGRKLAYNSSQPRQTSFWVRDLSTGKSNRLVSFPATTNAAFLNADGSMVAYSLDQASKRTIFTIPTAGGVGKRVLENTGGPTSWTRSGKIVHFFGLNSARGFDVVDPKTGVNRHVLETGAPLYQASFSPDETFVAFLAVNPGGQTNRIYVAPTGGNWPIPQSEWIPVTDGKQWDDKPNWSPDGNLLYMTSERDGYRCIWVRRMDPRTHHPIGDVFPVHHFHSSRRSMLNISLINLELAVARDRIAFAQGEVTGNVWLVKLP